MSKALSDNDVTVLGWVIPRPTGRWHQSIVVTSGHVWITPELTFANNEKLAAAADAGLAALQEYVRSAGWMKAPARCNLSDVRGVQWNETTGWMRIAGAGDHIIGAMIPNRETGNTLAPLLKQTIRERVSPAAANKH